MALNTRLLTEVRRNCVDNDVGADEAGAAPLEAIYIAEAWAEIAGAKVSVGFAALARGLNWCEELVAGDIVVQKEGRGEVGFETGWGREAV